MSKRKMLAAEEDLANKIVKLAEKKGLTVYQTVNDILQQTLKAEESGINIKEIVEKKGTIERAKGMGLTFTVEHLYYQLVELSLNKNHEKVKDLWRDMGFWYGKYFKTKNDSLKLLLEALEYMTYGSQFIVEKPRADELLISCINDDYPKGYTEVFSTFIEAAFQILGYHANEIEASRGIIRIKLKRG